LILAFVLGPMLELNLRQSLLVSHGSFLIFFTRPISAVAILLAIALFLTSFLPYLQKGKKRRRLQTED
jgi:putative tricarboxylic transport membrane protein